MKLSQLLLILLARKRLILISIVACLGAAVLLTLVLPKTYKATSQVVISSSGADPITGLTTPQMEMQSYLATQVGIITSRNVALKVVDALKLAEVEPYRRAFENQRRGNEDIRDWLAERLLKNLEAMPIKDGGIIQISAKWDDPQLAAAIANGFAHQYRQTTIQIKTNPLDEAGGYFDTKLKELRAALEEARNRMAQYQKETGIVSVDTRLDHETMRLNDLSSQLVAVQNQLSDANSRQQQALGKHPDDSPDVIANPVIQGLKTALAAAEARLSQANTLFTPEHPSYIRAQAEVDRLKLELRKNTQNMTNSVGTSVIILKQREKDLRRSLEEQKERVLNLNTERGRLAILSRDVENAQRAYDNTMTRASQINLEGRAKQTDVAVLSEAVVPSQAASPKPVLNLLLAMILGALSGGGVAFVAEMLNRKVRHAGDLADVLEAPVIGVMEWGMPKSMPRKWVSRLPTTQGPKLITS